MRDLDPESVRGSKEGSSGGFSPSRPAREAYGPDGQLEVPVSVFKDPKKWWRQNYLSWRFYTTIYASLALLVAVANTIAIISGISVHGMDKNYRVKLFEGSCGKARISSLTAHWFISGLGTYMLSASAYVMYCLTPPSRAEIDEEHSKGRWLDIGAMSFRNLMKVSKKRMFLFLALGLTSPLLQLFFNSFLFQTYSTNAYTAFVAQETLMEPGKTPANVSMRFSDDHFRAESLYHAYGGLVRHLYQKAAIGKMDRLSNLDCIDAYARPLQSNRRNVIVVTENDPSRLADVFQAYHAWIPDERRNQVSTNYTWSPGDSSKGASEQYSWICSNAISSNDQCLYHVEGLRADPAKWSIAGANVKYCLSEHTPEHCKLSFSLPLSLIVTFICFFKAAIMFAVAFFVYETPLMTTGDAISSFLSRPDPYTEDMCMLTKRLIQDNPNGWPRGPRYYEPKPRRWISAIKTRVFSCILLMLLALCFAGALYCTVNEPITLKNMIQLGLGAINRRFFIGWHRRELRGMFRSVFIANIGHAIFGCLYIMFNNIFYCMIFSEEWTRYALHRKGLRVSESPRGSQRTVYFFLMPYKLAFPIMAFSCAIHTLISQTLFFVDVEAYGHNLLAGEGMAWYTRQPEFDFSTTGFSPLANIGLIAVGLLMILFLVVFALRQYRMGVPVTSTCSAAISAACHPSPDEEEDAHLRPIQWGVTEVVDGIGHCTFSAKEVKEPDTITTYQ